MLRAQHLLSHRNSVVEEKCHNAVCKLLWRLVVAVVRVATVALVAVVALMAMALVAVALAKPRTADHASAARENSSYGPVVHDPYLSGGAVGSSVVPYQDQVYDGQVYNGQVYDGQVMGDQVIGGAPVYDSGTSYPSTGSTLQDNFDTRGDRIINAEPLPPGAVPVQ